ncbi:hypothetical protein Hanom_Chr04g00320451 [Helianthus anomalus]
MLAPNENGGNFWIRSIKLLFINIATNIIVSINKKVVKMTPKKGFVYLRSNMSVICNNQTK